MIRHPANARQTRRASVTPCSANVRQVVAAFVGVKYFGLGLILGPLAIACLFELLHFCRTEYAQSAA